MLTSATLAWMAAGIVAAIGAAVGKYLAYRYGRKTQEGIYKDAVLKKTLDMHKTASEVATNTPSNDDDIIARL